LLIQTSTHKVQRGPKSKPLPNYQKVVLNRIQTYQCDYTFSPNKSIDQALYRPTVCWY